jgi:hypothetical protein
MMAVRCGLVVISKDSAVYIHTSRVAPTWLNHGHRQTAVATKPYNTHNVLQNAELPGPQYINKTLCPAFRNLLAF